MASRSWHHGTSEQRWKRLHHRQLLSNYRQSPEPACEPSNGELSSYKRMAIVSHYQQLGCPPESEWGKHGGTLRQIADAFDMLDPCD